ncbi:MAG: PD40 domain-containing protein [Chloroflexi bacterium]|nr:PD40 domain-containing protein [Chloroflexota bacterium]
MAALAPGERGAGSFSASARLPAYGERELRVGSFDGDRYIGGLLFSLSKIPPSSRVSYVALELAGLSDSQTLPEGEWTVELLDPEPAEGWADLSYATLLSAPATQMRTAWRLSAADLAARKVNVLEFSPDALDLFAQRLAEGRLAFRILGPDDAATNNLFIWDTGYGEGFGTRPVLRVGFVPPTATPTPPGRSAGGGAQATPLPLVVWIGVPTAAPAAPTPTPYPMALYDSLRGKILFVSDRFAVPEGAAAPPAGFTRPAGLTQPEQLMVYDPATGRLGQVTQTWPWTLAQARSARGADLTVSVGERTQIVVRDRYSEGPRDVGVDEGDNYDPAVSPDGEWIVFVSNRHHNDEIYTMRRDGAMLRRLTENDWAWDKQPSFSPDGGRIVFWSNRDGNKQLYIMNADGTEQRNVSNNAFNDWAPVWVR